MRDLSVRSGVMPAPHTMLFIIPRATEPVVMMAARSFIVRQAALGRSSGAATNIKSSGAAA